MTAVKLGAAIESTGLPLRQALPLLGKAGADCLQFDAFAEVQPDQLGTTARREVRTLIKGAQLELAAIYCPLRHGLDTFENQQPRLDQVKRVMALAIDLGAKRIIVPLPAIPVAPPENAETPAAALYVNFNTKPHPGVTLRESVLALGLAGDHHGIQVGLEVGADAAVATREYIRSFDVGSLAVVFDPASILVKRRDVLAELMQYNDALGAVFARDARMGRASSEAQEVPLGAGDVDWLSVLAGLAAAEFGGPMIYRRLAGVGNSTEATAALAFVRRFVPRM